MPYRQVAEVPRVGRSLGDAHDVGAGRDFPLATLLLYKFMLRVPHEDKLVTERLLVGGAAEGGVLIPL
ncbi:hypothetical protein F4804DRAFT_333818 [Jackrogersella minutella]|nr:hypothetical protein F4804DRAFT_333818 [Jackrogersella minutella]